MKEYVFSSKVEREIIIIIIIYLQKITRRSNCINFGSQFKCLPNPNLLRIWSNSVSAPPILKKEPRDRKAIANLSCPSTRQKVINKGELHLPPSRLELITHRTLLLCINVLDVLKQTL